jgi:hypothetical protein
MLEEIFYSILFYFNCAKKSRVYPTLFCSNYFHKESTPFEKAIPFS